MVGKPWRQDRIAVVIRAAGTLMIAACTFGCACGSSQPNDAVARRPKYCQPMIEVLAQSYPDDGGTLLEDLRAIAPTGRIAAQVETLATALGKFRDGTSTQGWSTSNLADAVSVICGLKVPSQTVADVAAPPSG
jgi:hypothetical protein